MLFSFHDDSKEKKNSGSLLGFLFNPRLGNDIKPLVHETRLFVRLLAMILASCELFPKDHPALTDDNEPISFADVVRLSWTRLSFTREGIPQIALFIAVYGCLIFSFLFVVTLITSFFVVPAHADDSIFTSPTTTDWGHSWLRYLFFGEPIKISLENSTSVSGCTMQSGIAAMLSFYSSAVLVLAGFILLYHLTTMIVDTAHTGKFMGQANQVWAPIRLVIAIGLLVPIATGSGSSSNCNISGYNTAQYIVIKVAEMGSGLASNAWVKFLDALSSSEAGTSCTDGSPSCPKVTSEAGTFARTMIVNYACAYINNAQTASAGGELSADNNFDYISQPTTNISWGSRPTTYYFGMHTGDKQQFCGGISVLPVPSDPYTAVYDAQLTVVNKYLKDFDRVAQKAFGYYANQNTIEPTDALQEVPALIDNFSKDLQSAVDSSIATADGHAKEKFGGTTSDSIYSKTGWLSAGAWFNTIAKIQSQRSGAIHNALPKALPPLIASLNDKDTKGVKSTKERTVNAVAALSAALDLNITTQNFDATTASKAGIDEKGVFKTIMSFINPVDMIAYLIELGGRVTGILTDSGEISLRFNETQNPLWELAAFGQGFVTAGTWFITFSALASISAEAAQGAKDGNIDAAVVNSLTAGGAGALAGAAIGTLKVAANLLSMMAGLFFMMGFTIGYILPLFPFFRFFFGALTWIVAVFEAVVSAPLFALAHMTPYGEGLFGNGGAKRGYFQLLQILLRPILMIFGLGAGFLLFNVAINFLNAMFAVAAAGTGALTGGTPAIARLVYMILYCGLAYICANTCFQTIGMFPQKALVWLGGGMHEERMGDPGKMGAIAGAIASHGLQQASTGLSGFGGKKIKEIAASNQAAQDKAAALEAAKETKDWRASMLASQNSGNISGNGAEAAQNPKVEKSEAAAPGGLITPPSETGNPQNPMHQEDHGGFRGHTVFGDDGKPTGGGGGSAGGGAGGGAGKSNTAGSNSNFSK